MTGYRKSSSVDILSPRWRAKHRAFLSSCGVPPEVIASDRAWGYVLLHGDDELNTGWNPAWMPKEQAERLLHFLESEIESGLGYDLLRKLRKRIEE